MEYCVDGDFYSVSTPPSSRNDTRQELHDIIESRLKLAAMGIDTHNDYILSAIGIDVHDDYIASKILRNMYNQINDIGKLVDDIVQQDIMKNVANSVHPRTRSFINELNIIRGGSDDDYIRVADEVIRDAIANGMLSADITHFRNETKRVTIKTPDKTMARSYGEDDEISPRMREVIEQTEQQRNEEQPVTKVKPVKTKKFKIGEHYLIHPMNNKKLRREFVVKKTIYSIKDREVNIVIMKQISGPESTTKFTLSKEDCLKFHLKYEDGLQVCSMELDWKLLKSKK
jgi:hypothetical protein